MSERFEHDFRDISDDYLCHYCAVNERDHAAYFECPVRLRSRVDELERLLDEHTNLRMLGVVTWGSEPVSLACRNCLGVRYVPYFQTWEPCPECNSDDSVSPSPEKEGEK